MSFQAPLAELLSLGDSVGSGIFGVPTDDLSTLIYFDGKRARVLGAQNPGGGASTFVQLTDTPSTLGAIGQLPHVGTTPGGGVALTWRDAPREVPSAAGVTNGFALLANNGSYAWSALPPALTAVLARGAIYVGNNVGQATPLAPGPFNSSLQSNGTDLFWGSRFFSFSDLLDTPGTLGQAGQMLRVNNERTGLEYFTLIVGAPSLSQNHIFVGNAQGQAASIPAGPEGSFFTVNNGVPSWSVLDGIFKARGAWDASTGNAPTESPVAGDYYTVSTAGNFGGIFYGTDDAIYYAEGAWHKVEGGQGLTANNSLIGADDTEATAPAAGQGYVWDPTGNPQVGVAGSGAFVLQDFVRAEIEPSTGYNAGRVLEADGDQFISVDKIAMPRLPLLGSLWVQDPVNGPQALPPSTTTSVLVGNSLTGKPEYKEFQTLLNAASIPNYSLAAQNQILTTNRSVLIGANLLTMATVGNYAALALDGANRRVILSSTSTLNAVTKIEVAGSRIDMDFQNGSVLRLPVPGSGLIAGFTGQALVSKGDIVSPTWDFPRCVLTSPNGKKWQVYVDNDGSLVTVELNPTNFQPLFAADVPA